jgi:hypothetical protein
VHPLKFVFLDIDGVLAPYTSLGDMKYTCQDILPPNGCLQFDPFCVAELNHICMATKASIIVSSSWRHYIRDLEKMRAMLRSQGVNAPIAGMTPEAEDSWPDHSRGAEVKQTLDLVDAEGFVILDDADMGWIGLEDKWVKTDCNKGLTAIDSANAIAILNT